MIRPDPRAWLLASLIVVSALYGLAPHRVSDADALSRLAMGRLLSGATYPAAEQSSQPALSLPASDPFTFANPGARFGDPEWLGDLGLYALYTRLGETGLQAGALVIASAGYVLSIGLGLAFGASPASLTAMLLCTLPAAAARVAARNDLHMWWLLPLFAWIAASTAAQPRRFGWLLLLGWLWANLHSSFVLGLPLMAAAIADLPDRRQRLPWIAVGCYPLLPWLGLSGASSYAQLIDHLLGGATYRGLLSEWQSPLSSSGLLAIAPLHLLFVLGALSVWRRRREASWLQIAMFAGASALAYGSRRFLPLTAALMVPVIAVHVSRLGSGGRLVQRRTLSAIAVIVAGIYVALGLRSVNHRVVASVFGRPETPERAARFIAAHARAGSRLANVFNDGPWLLWFSAPRVRHYLDPRNNLGAPVLAHYIDEVLADPTSFEAEAKRLNISLALMRARDPRSASLASYLTNAPNWPLIYWDGYHALHARADREQTLIEHFAYRKVRPQFDLSYLDGRMNDPALERDLKRLEQETPPVAQAIRAYQALVAGDAIRAAAGFEAALPELPESRELLTYWARSLRPR